MTTKKFRLDVWHKNSNVVRVIKGETCSRFLDITIVDAAKPVDLSGTSVKIHLTKPDGNIIFNETEIINAQEGKISVALTAQMSAITGNLISEIRIISESGAVLKVPGPTILVFDGADDQKIESSSEFTALTEALLEVRKMQRTIEDIPEFQDLQYIIDYINTLETTTSNYVLKTFLGVYENLEALLESNKSFYEGDSAIFCATSSFWRFTGGVWVDTNVQASAVSVNGKVGDLTLSYDDLEAVPNTRQINGKSLFSDITINCSDISAVPISTKVNGRALTGDIHLTFEDVGASGSAHSHRISELEDFNLVENNILKTAKIASEVDSTNKDLQGLLRDLDMLRERILRLDENCAGVVDDVKLLLEKLSTLEFTYNFLSTKITEFQSAFELWSLLITQIEAKQASYSVDISNLSSDISKIYSNIGGISELLDEINGEAV